MRARLLLSLLAIVSCIMSSCVNHNVNTTTVTSAVIYLALDGIPGSMQTYTATLNSGALSQFGQTLPTGNLPTAMVLTPSLSTLFIDNNNSGNITSFGLNTDGSLAAGSTTADKTGNANAMPMGMAVDPGGKFLFVANQGANSISVFSINGTGLTAVSGSPFCNTPNAVSPTCTPVGTDVATLPTAVIVSASGNFLYVANNFTGTLSVYKIASSGALTPIGASPYLVGTAPSGVGLLPNGGFLYVANTGSNDISGFAICDKVITSCSNPNNPDGTLTPVNGSPFAAGLGPIAVAADPFFNFLYVLDKQSFQISGYAVAPGTGILTALSTPAVSTGTTPLSFVIIAGATGTNTGNTLTEPTDFIYVANNGASSVTAFSLSTTSGVLSPLGTPTSIPGNPTVIGAN